MFRVSVLLRVVHVLYIMRECVCVCVCVCVCGRSYRHYNVTWITALSNDLKAQRSLLRTARFNMHKCYVVPTQCVYAFFVDLRTNSDYFPIQL
jgi:hypothetical protein